jgi:hypothetical protein
LHHAGLRGFKYTEQLFFSAINVNGESVALDGATTIKPSSKLTVKFNSAVDATTVNENNFVLKTKAGVAVATSRTVSEDKKTVTVAPVNLLDVKADYVLTVSKNVKQGDATNTLANDVVANFSTADVTIQTAFKAGIGGSNFSSAVAVTGSATKTNAAVLYVGYNKALDANTVNTSTVKLYNATDSKFVQGAVAYDAATYSLSFTPVAAEITGNKQYEIRVSGVKGLDGATAEDYTGRISIGSSINFALNDGKIATTKDSGNINIYPGIVSKSVWRGNTSTTITASPFQLSIQVAGTLLDQASLSSVKLVEFDAKNNVVKANTEVAGTWTYDAATYKATFAPTAALKESTDYAVVIGKDTLKDAAGISATTTREDGVAATFKTSDYTAPVITTDNVANGATGVAVDAKIKLKLSEKVNLGTFVPVTTPFKTAQLDGTHSVVLETADGVTGIDITAVGAIALDPTDVDEKTIVVDLGKAATPLAVNTAYKLTIKGTNYDGKLAAADTTGNELAQDFTLVFTTVEAKAPKATSVKGISYKSPAASTTANLELISGTEVAPVVGVTGIGAAATNQILEVTFDQAMKLAADTTGANHAANWAIQKWNGTNWTTSPDTPATVAAKAGTSNKTFTVTPSTTFLSGEARYRLVVLNTVQSALGKAIKDTAGETVLAYFNTTVAAPEVSTVKYDDNSDGNYNTLSGAVKAADLNAKGIEVTLKEAVLKDTLKAANFVVTDLTTGEQVVGGVYKDAAKAAITADATTVYWYGYNEKAFVEGHNYRLTVNNLKDLVGTPMEAPFVLNFSTTDTAAPAVTAVSVTNGALDVSVDPTITIEFSKDVSGTKPDATTITLTKVGGAAVACDVKYDKATKKATLTTNEYLAPLTQYVLHIDNSIATAASTSIGVDTDITFTTENVTKKAAITSAALETKADGSKRLTIKFDKPMKAAASTVSFGTTAADNNTFLVTGVTGDIWDFAAANAVVSIDRKTITLNLSKNALVEKGLGLFITTANKVSPEAGEFKQYEAWDTDLATTQANAVTSGNYIVIE